MIKYYKMGKKYVGGLFFVFLFCACVPDKVNIRAIIQGCGEQKVYIMEHGDQSFDYYVVDSVKVQYDSFEICLENTYPRDILLVFEESRERVIPLYVEAGDISITGVYKKLKQVEKKGTPTLDLQNQFNELILPLQLEMNLLLDTLKRVEEEYSLNPNEVLNAKGAMLSGRMYGLQNRINQLKDSVITANPANVFTAALLMSNQPLMDLPRVEALLARLAPDMPDNIYRDRMISLRDRLQAIQVGKVAPEIELENIEGDTVCLSSLQGNIVLINFWFSWETGCLENYIQWMELYNQYHFKGFEIFSVSMDDNLNPLIQVIKKNNLGGIHVIERTGKYIDRYFATTLPTTYLLDQDGKIIGKNLTMEELKAKLVMMLP